ncbi:hypothetical protein PLEOSDRAFT_171716 [Pleurotus ostreatus PC15]|uniref:Ribonuclease H1 N-terminal domain-containing protein n=1 Tax=Pleurotus ostreatus (strain PC15) TaxID=1137138 RepID=A0A067N2R7_PLEO1|nr:hypothetical protein PLEOSDRAFT_171716 [Pleurotus ostreatus PC15]
MQTTTVSDLIQFLTQLNTGNAAPAPNAVPAPAVAPATANVAPAPAVAPAAANVAPAPAVAPAAANVAPAPAVAPAADVAPAVAPAANVAPAPANAPGNAAQAPFSAVFQCPNCDTVHFLGPVNVSAVPGAAPAPAANPGLAALAVPVGNQASPSNTAGRWYSVTHGRQIGVFRDWYGVVEPLVNGVPDWRCKSFSTYAAAANHFNTHLAAGMARVYNEPSVEAGDAVDTG